MNEKLNADHFETFNDLLHHCKIWISEEDYDAFYRWFDFEAMKDFIKELDKQEKIINAMAKDIYTTDLYEKICTKNTCDCYINEFAGEHSACFECIKQYYEKKVSEDNAI